MVKLLLALLLVAVPAFAGAQDTSVATAPPAPSEISGTWMRSDGSARINVVSCGGQMCATNTWLRETNGDEAVGDKLVMSLTPSGQGAFAGFGYDVKRDKKYSLQISLEDGGRMKTEGCMLAGIVCKTMRWKRLQ
jgi:uncharacterized protein (DUF2147 family)